MPTTSSADSLFHGLPMCSVFRSKPKSHKHDKKCVSSHSNRALFPDRGHDFQRNHTDPSSPNTISNRPSTVSPASNASKDTRAPAGTSTRLVGRARRCSACAAPTSRGPRAGRTWAGSPSRARRASATGRPSCTPEAPAPRARRWTELGVSPVTPDYFLLAKGSYTPRSPRIVKHRLQTPSIFLVTWS
jgi:hypothetical protein